MHVLVRSVLCCVGRVRVVPGWKSQDAHVLSVPLLCWLCMCVCVCVIVHACFGQVCAVLCWSCTCRAWLEEPGCARFECAFAVLVVYVCVCVCMCV